MFPFVPLYGKYFQVPPQFTCCILYRFNKPHIDELHMNEQCNLCILIGYIKMLFIYCSSHSERILRNICPCLQILYCIIVIAVSNPSITFITLHLISKHHRKCQRRACLCSLLSFYTRIQYRAYAASNAPFKCADNSIKLHNCCGNYQNIKSVFIVRQLSAH